VLRVTFTAPVVPGIGEVLLTGTLMDAHGNALVAPGAPVAVAAGGVLASAFDGDPVLDAVEDKGGDTVTLVFTQALDPATTEEFGRWDVQSPTGVSLDLSTAALTYDFPTKTLVIVLAEDVLTGDTFTVAPSAGPDAPIEIDGESFTASFSGTVTGDAVAVVVEGAVQDRDVVSDGMTLDVSLSERRSSRSKAEGR
jgi:hypothetical protein